MEKARNFLPSIVTAALIVIWHAVLSTSVGAAQQEQRQKQTSRRTVVFVCEHGAAKSVVAAAWFNKLAAERHLPFHAVARGFTPQENLSESAVAGLRREGVPFSPDKPQSITASDAKDAVRIVALDPPPPSAQSLHAEVFEVPAPNDGYDRSREVIVARVKAVLEDLTRHQPR